MHDIGPVFRVCVPQILYFAIMWTGTFLLIQHLSKRESAGYKGTEGRTYGYDTAVSQAFTAASNNFVRLVSFFKKIVLIILIQELAIAVCISVYGINSEQALAATIGPLTEVPVLLSLTWLALYLRHKLTWEIPRTPDIEDESVHSEKV